MPEPINIGKAHRQQRPFAHHQLQKQSRSDVVKHRKILHHKRSESYEGQEGTKQYLLMTSSLHSRSCQFWSDHPHFLPPHLSPFTSSSWY
jgi:hypothetical protein